MKQIIYIQEIIENFIANPTKQALFIKHYNTQEIKKSDLLELMPHHMSAVCYYHEYLADVSFEAYEPFLAWIRSCYVNFYQNSMTATEFLRECNVYSLHLEPFSTYIETGHCKRTEDIMSIEVKFETAHIFTDILNIFQYITKEHSFILIMSAFHFAPLSSVQAMLHLLKAQIPHLHFIVIYNDTFYIRPYISNDWNTLITYIRDKNLLYEWGKFSSDIDMNTLEDFTFNPRDFSTNIVKLWNMYYTLALEDAQYYISDIYHKVEHNHSILTEQETYEILVLHTLLHICMDDYEKAIMSCKAIAELQLYQEDLMVSYHYYYLSILTQFFTSQMDAIKGLFSSCMDCAIKLENDFLAFKAELLYCMAQFGGWRDIFLCDFRIPVPTDLLNKAKKYNYRNHLAYLYAMGFENDEKSVNEIATGKKNSYYFARGIALAKELGNNDFLMSAYMKNIIIYSDAGHHEYVYQMHKKRIETVDSNDHTLQAHMYLGIGYNCVILENYQKADDYFRLALRKLIEEEKADDCMDALYNISMNYFVIEDYEAVIACIETLLKMLSYLGYQCLMVCNTSKLYGMLAISYFNLHDFYNAYHYHSLMDILLSPFLKGKSEEDYKYWEEDFFLYHYIKAILYEYEANIEASQKELDSAYQFMWMLPGTMFYTYSLYAIAQANIYEKLSDLDSRTSILEHAIDYYKRNGFVQYARKLIAFQKHEKFPKTVIAFHEHELQFERLLNIANFEGTQLKLKNREKDIAFLTIWQENLNRKESDINNLIQQAISIIQNTYSLSDMILLKKEKEDYSILHNNSNINLSTDVLKMIFNFFDRYQRGFFTNRTDKNFNHFTPLIKPFQKNKVMSMLGIPISDETTDYVLLGHVNSQRNFSGNRILLSNENLITLKFAFNQLIDAIKRITDTNLIRHMNEELEKSSMTDYLTGIYNRQGFSYIIEEKLNKNVYSHSLILYIDLDNFKYYNDTFGHDAGDFVLVRFTQILQKLIGDLGYSIRYGGDEFVVIIPNQTESYGQKIATLIYQEIADGFLSALKEYIGTEIVIPKDKQLSCSIGITEYSGNTQRDIDEALKSADQALYFIKRNSKGRAMTWSKLKELQL